MKRYNWLLIMLITITMCLSSCEISEQEDYIQGTWVFANEQGDPRATELHVFHEWWFGGGRFDYHYEVFVGYPEVAEGRYRIIESSEDRIILEIYFVKTNTYFSENQQVILNIEREIDSLRINRVLYYRGGY